ncbi:uncharacterized protein C8Q71DRAFT_730404 [Rhodofomes roseus]|uniref:Uncharacterized protein n=1 Tax=Rhodofomes roseus TaxID=34475 RepID=A0ABQ8KX58_9APHY|nr:uncharacterized protein C8Q71DRAFT_730404 [Rhodofomes roseus]KAH9843882.1 hypothetical protein C8Q71DRAFT_730404 [Rhodofomes roseus]
MATIFPPPSPELPQFHTLLVRGPYHPSAPIHLVLSHNWRDPKGKAIFISPSRAAFLASLAKFDDEWLKVHGGDGLTCSASARIENLYPPTPAHLVMILSMLHVYEGTLHDPKTTLPEAPTLFVLHELSALLKPTTLEPTLSSYLSLIMHALTAVNSLSAKATASVALAVFDSGLQDLKLPIIRPVSPSGGDPNEARPSTGRREPVAFFVEQYFEWTARVEAFGETEAHSEGQAGGGRMRMVMHRTPDGDNIGDIAMEWMVATRVAGPHAGARYFAWT